MNQLNQYIPKGNAYPEPAAPIDPMIRVRMDYLEGTIGGLEQRIDVLMNAIDTILRPSDPSTNTG